MGYLGYGRALVSVLDKGISSRGQNIAMTGDVGASAMQTSTWPGAAAAFVLPDPQSHRYSNSHLNCHCNSAQVAARRKSVAQCAIADVGRCVFGP